MIYLDMTVRSKMTAATLKFHSGVIVKENDEYVVDRLLSR